PNDTGVILYAALGDNFNDPANGVYWTFNPASASLFAPPAWNLGDPGGSVDNENATQFPTGAPPANLIPPFFGPDSNGNIKFAVIPNSGAGGGTTIPTANDTVYAA